ncbi:MAG TPA: type II/IV secretion system protein, partial [Burkholderiales bacterium]
MNDIAEKLHLAGIALDEMRGLAPAFDALPYADALRRCCVGLRADDGMLLVVLGNPYDLDTQDWIEERLREP